MLDRNMNNSLKFKNMKHIILVIALIISMIGAQAFALTLANDSIINTQENIVVEKFKVYGNCGMCKARIETAACKIDAVYEAHWGMYTKVIEVAYDANKTTLDSIKKNIAAMGYDTEKFRAAQSVYDYLPQCCQYERPNSSINDSSKSENDNMSKKKLLIKLPPKKLIDVKEGQ